MRAIILPAFAFALGFGFLSAPEAQARFNAAQLDAPSLVEDAQCVTRRIRTVRPNGRVIYRTVTDCGVRARPRWRDRCRTIRERVVRPNGRVVYREIRRCR
ncbi:MAG TPA: hypothetical protein VEZ16_07420 [Microvirga sp.]|nr:hypothetical protein [Microvirga sp.]